jgi:hypothetical protein
MDALVVALVGLGGLYVIAEEKKAREGFTEKLQPQTFPVFDPVVRKSEDDYIQKYDHPNQTTDKFLRKHNAPNEIVMSDPVINPTDISKFKHNNMVPFFGSSVKGINIENHSQTLLDSYTGAGSQDNSKKEQAPLFKPEDNVQWAHGAPDSSDFYQERQVLGNAHNNTKPWQEQQVGPGLGQGYSATGSGGFNSGMEDRKEWMPKTVDQLRVDTNPRTVGKLNGLEGPAQSKITNTGIEGTIEKNRPNTDYVLGPERFFTTTGSEIAPTAHSTQMMGHVNRPETNVEHYGIGGSTNIQKQKAPEKYSALAKNPQNCSDYIGNAYINGAHATTKNDNNVDSYYAAPNNRVTTKNATEFGIVGSVIGSVMAPVLDMLRPSRKENVIGNIRESGNVQQHVGGYYVINPGDRPKTTIKEMTTGEGNHINVQAQHEGIGAYKVTDFQPSINQRDTTNVSECGNPNSNVQGLPQQDAYMHQRNNVNKGQMEYTPSGNDNLFNGNINAEMCTNRGVCNARGLAPTVFSSSPSVNTLGRMNTATYKQSQPDTERIDCSLLDAFKQNPYTHSLQTY